VPQTGIVTNPQTVQDAVNGLLGTNLNVFGASFDPVTGALPLSQTTGGAPVDLHDLATALVLGKVHAMIVDDSANTIRMGRSTRLFTGAARSAVLFASDRCSRCHRRHHGIQVDHMRPWPHGGRTDPDNGAPLGGLENRLKHELRLQLTRDGTGYHWWRPDGTEIAPRPAPTPPTARATRDDGANPGRAGPDAA
jgi:hypothetical protein